MRDRKGVYLDGIGSNEEQGGEVGGKTNRIYYARKAPFLVKGKNNKK